jgi:hypothetical protein
VKGGGKSYKSQGCFKNTYGVMMDVIFGVVFFLEWELFRRMLGTVF